MLLINFPSRIHITLVAMHDCIIRKNGGIGFSVNNENSSIKAKKSESNSLTPFITKTKERKIIDILKILNHTRDKYNFTHGVEIDLSNIAGFHLGLGTGTALTLACIESLFLINEKEYTQEEIIYLSSRGGTSGIGINSYFNGGFVFDSGVKVDGTHHRPSSAVIDNITLPTLISSLDMPDWKLCIVHPIAIHGIEGSSESNFFEKTCPIDESEAYKACYYSIFGVLTSIVEADYNSFCHSINILQRTEWKRSEINANDGIKEKIDYLNSLGADCVGLSSIGPAIYIFGKNLDDLKNKFTLRYGWHGFITSPNNSGRSICWS